MIYNHLWNMIRPFFVSRAEWALTTPEMMDNYINLAIQDIWNYYSWAFKIKAEDLTSEANWDYLKWTTTYPIESIIEIYDEYDNQITPVTKKIFDDKECNVWENFIITTSEVTEINIRYYRAYDWRNLSEHGAESLPFPNKFIPPLLNKIYDLASPLSYFEDDNAIPRYQIAVRQLDELKRNDWVSSDVYFTPDNVF